MKKQPEPPVPAKKKPKKPAGTKKVQKKMAGLQRQVQPMDWEAVFRAIGLPSFILAPDHMILSANEATCCLAGKTEPELRGMKCWEVFHGPHATHPPPGCPMVAVISSKKHETAEMEVAMNGGICLVSCTPVFNARGVVSSIIHIATDITEKKNADRIVLEREDKFRQIFENSPLGMALVTPDFRFFSVNPAWISKTGYTENELLKLSFKDITHPDHLAGDLEHMRELAAGKIPVYSTEKRYIRKDGSILWGLIRVTTIRDNQGSLQHFAAQIEDITPRRQAEDALRESEEKYRNLYRNSAIGIFHSSLEGRFIDVNPSLAKMLGYNSPEEAATSITSIAEQVYFEPPRYNAVTTTALEKGEIVGVENRYRRRDGSLWYGMLHVRIVPDEQGRPGHYEGFVEDISDRKKAEELLRESEIKFATVFRSSPVALTLVSATDGIVVDVNDAFVRNSGYSREEIIGKTTDQLGLFPDAAERGRMLSSLRNQQNINGMELKCRIKTGEILICLLSSGLINMGEKPYIVSTIENISDRKRVEDALRESEAKFRTLFESADDAIFIMDGTTFLDCNSSTLRIYGCTRDQIIGHTPVEFSPEQQPDGRLSVEKAQEKIALALARQPQSFEWVHLHVDGTPFNAEVTLNRISLKDGDFLQAIVRDITDRKQSEEALNKAHTLLNETQALSHLGGWEYDVATGKITWTDEVYRIHGVGHDFDPGFVSRDIQFYAQKDAPVIEQAFRRCCEKGEPYDLELELMRADGRQIWVRTMGKPVRQDGRIVRVHGNIIDITERWQAEDSLRQRTEELDNRNRLISTLLDTVPIGIFMVEAPSGRPIIANREATRLLGRGILPDVTETNLAEVYEAYRAGTAEEYPTPEMPVVRGLGGESSHIDDMEVLRPDGTRVLLEIFGNPITDSHNRVLASLVSFLDITDRKQADELRERFIRELARKNADLDRFTYTVSHDLKSPLVAIRAFLSLLKDDLKAGDTGQVENDITRISESAEKLENLITTLLALSRSGKSVDAPVRMPFSDLAREAAGLLDTTLRDRGITLVIPDTLPVISGDRVRLLQVMTNLLDNAVKFMGDQKKPRIEIGILDDFGTPLFFVKDNGMGFKSENLQKGFGLYERFNPDIPGTGIGLATVKRVIEAHGGKIWIESKGEGKGTTVCFTLPAGKNASTDTHNNG
jgi:PAS domain S-box-containing protein